MGVPSTTSPAQPRQAQPQPGQLVSGRWGMARAQPHMGFSNTGATGTLPAARTGTRSRYVLLLAASLQDTGAADMGFQ